MPNDEEFMAAALELAREAAAGGEVPIGAVVVFGDAIIGKGRNRVEEKGDAAAHAEMEALANASRAIGRRRLLGATLYVTLEPCPMCAFAALLARIDRIVFAAADPKFGGCGSVVHIPAAPFNHRLAVAGGVCAAESTALLRDFFKTKRP